MFEAWVQSMPCGAHTEIRAMIRVRGGKCDLKVIRLVRFYVLVKVLSQDPASGHCPGVGPAFPLISTPKRKQKGKRERIAGRRNSLHLMVITPNPGPATDKCLQDNLEGQEGPPALTFPAGTAAVAGSLKREKSACSHMFRAVPLTKARQWKQPKYPLLDVWIIKMSYICTEIYIIHLLKREFQHRLQHG